MQPSATPSTGYVKGLGDRLTAAPTGPRGQIRVYLTDAPPQTAARGPAAVGAVVTAVDGADVRRTAARTYIGAAVRAAVVPTDDPWDAELATDDDAELMA